MLFRVVPQQRWRSCTTPRLLIADAILRPHRFLRAIGLLGHWLLPNHIECAACDIAKAKQAPHCGTLEPAQYPNEIIHVDLMNMKIADIHGNLHSMTIVDGKSRRKTVYPMRTKSDSTKALQKYFGFIRREYRQRRSE